MDSESGTRGVSGHFGKQLRTDRIAHGWTISELAQLIEVNAGHLGRIEAGKRPPTAKIATALDKVFPERRGAYLKWVDDVRYAPEVPATFKDWSNFEERTLTLRCWTPGITDGLAQTPEYAEGLLETDTTLDARGRKLRLAVRMARQKRILDRPNPPMITLLVDMASLYRQVGTPETMAAQMRHLAELAARPNIILQIVPEVGHASMVSAFMIADDAVWSEHTYEGGSYTDAKILSDAALRFATLQSESLRASESLAVLVAMEERWTGGNPRTAALPADSA